MVRKVEFRSFAMNLPLYIILVLSNDFFKANYEEISWSQKALNYPLIIMWT